MNVLSRMRIKSAQSPRFCARRNRAFTVMVTGG